VQVSSPLGHNIDDHEANATLYKRRTLRNKRISACRPVLIGRTDYLYRSYKSHVAIVKVNSNLDLIDKGRHFQGECRSWSRIYGGCFSDAIGLRIRCHVDFNSKLSEILRYIPLGQNAIKFSRDVARPSGM
jgi:hypothetical protein